MIEKNQKSPVGIIIGTVAATLIVVGIAWLVLKPSSPQNSSDQSVLSTVASTQTTSPIVNQLPQSTSSINKNVALNSLAQAVCNGYATQYNNSLKVLSSAVDKANFNVSLNNCYYSMTTFYASGVVDHDLFDHGGLDLIAECTQSSADPTGRTYCYRDYPQPAIGITQQQFTDLETYYLGN
jgi:hypothetical protein